MAQLRGLVIPDAAADRVVPPTGLTARLTLFSALSMAFLAVFALALSLAAGRLADSWGEDLARTSTVRITAPPKTWRRAPKLRCGCSRPRPESKSARALDVDEQQDLLEPWFGPDIPVDALPVPQLIDVTETVDGYDSAGLRLRLNAEVPGAVLDDHARWRVPLVDAASRLRLLGWVCIVLIAAATGAMITLASHAALAAQRPVIAVLRLVGATDDYIAGAFVRRFTLRALAGASLGTLLAMAAILLMPDAGEAGGFLTGFGFRGWHWVLPLLVPPLAGIVALAATLSATRRMLGGLS